MPASSPQAPALQVSRWFNTDNDLDLPSLMGKVVVIEAFQMLCPGCVSHGLPLAQAIHDTFPKDNVSVMACIASSNITRR